MTAVNTALARLDREVLASLSVGDRLPSEAELVEQLAVSRATVRDALSRLAAEGTIERRWGVGTFFVDRDPRPRVTSMAFALEGGLARVLSSTGGRPSLVDFSFASAAPAPDLLPDFSDTPTFRIFRVFALDEVPVVSLTDVVPREFDGRRFEPAQLGSIDRTMQEILADIGIDWTAVDLEIWADLPTPDMTERLRLAPNEPVTRTIARGREADGRRLFVGEGTYRSSHLRLRMTTTATPSPTRNDR